MPTLEELQSYVTAAQAELHQAVVDQCPGIHRPVQHRDGKPPWCGLCGLTATGLRPTRRLETGDAR